MRRNLKILFIVIIIVGALAGVIYLLIPSITFGLLDEVPGKQTKVSGAGKYNAFPKAIRTSDTSTNPEGSILATWYSGDDHVDSQSDGKIMGAISQDNGVLWTVPFVIYDHAQWDCRNIGLARAVNGTLILFFAWVEGHTSTGHVWMDFGYIKSYDHGVTWSAFTSLAKNATNLADIVGIGNGYGDMVLVDTDLYILNYGRAPGTWAESHTTYLFKSTDNGETWSYTSDLNKGTGISTNEADCWYADGKIFGFSRTAGDNAGGKLYYFETTNLGQTWSPLQRTNIDGQSPDILRLSDGRYLVSYRTKDGWGNNYVGYFLLAKDFGTNSPSSTQLAGIDQKCLIRTSFGEGRSDMAYPSMLLLSQQRVLIVYYDIAAGGVFVRIIQESKL